MKPSVTKKASTLPQAKGESWEGGSWKMRVWITPKKEPPYRPYGTLWIEPQGDWILGQDMYKHQPTSDEVFQSLLKCMQKPLVGSPRRPTEVRLSQRDLGDALREPLASLDIQCTLVPELRQWERIVKMMETHLSGQEPLRGLLTTPGVTPEAVAALFSAAAEFYRQAPWKYVGDDLPFQVECEPLLKGSIYAVVMGHGKMEYGLAIYESLKQLEQIYQGSLPPEVLHKRMKGQSILFGDITKMPFDDLDALERYGWEIVGPEAYPVYFEIVPRVGVHPPGARKLEIMQLCLLVLPPVVTAHKAALRQRQRFAEERWVETHTGKKAVRVSCPPEAWA